MLESLEQSGSIQAHLTGHAMYMRQAPHSKRHDRGRVLESLEQSGSIQAHLTDHVVNCTCVKHQSQTMSSLEKGVPFDPSKVGRPSQHDTSDIRVFSLENSFPIIFSSFSTTCAMHISADKAVLMLSSSTHSLPIALTMVL